MDTKNFCPEPKRSKLYLHNDEVHIWKALIDYPSEIIDGFVGSLSPFERSRAEEFKFNRDRNRYIASQYILRTLISRHYLPIDIKSIQFHTEIKGKPVIEQNRSNSYLDFNKSDSREICVYAFALNSKIGIDVEYIRPVKDIELIARQSFSEYENAALSTVSSSLKHLAFYNCWTRKEAFIKAIGEGLYFPLDKFDVTLLPGDVAQILHLSGLEDHPSNWTLLDFTPEAGYSAALAINRKNFKFYFWQFQFNF
jgi:4'-phosphopantetheinyl transferase